MTLCSHCRSAPARKAGLCDADYQHQRRTGELPSWEVIRRRVERTIERQFSHA